MNNEAMAVAEAHDVVDALESPEKRARVGLAEAITAEIRRRGLSQTQAAKLLGIRQPDVSAIMNARVDGIGQERLERLLNALDLEVRIQVGPRPAGKERAGITVQVVESF